MVLDHWSNDAMVLMDCYGLVQHVVLRQSGVLTLGRSQAILLCYPVFVLGHLCEYCGVTFKCTTSTPAGDPMQDPRPPFPCLHRKATSTVPLTSTTLLLTS